jgi:hypothetical protein
VEKRVRAVTRIKTALSEAGIGKHLADRAKIAILSHHLTPAPIGPAANVGGSARFMPSQKTRHHDREVF